MKKFDSKKFPTVEIDQTANRYSVSFSDGGSVNKSDEKRCVENTKILSPITWKIETSPDSKRPYLLVFHLLPQTASRKLKEEKVTTDTPDGPECDNLDIIFVSDFNNSKMY